MPCCCSVPCWTYVTDGFMKHGQKEFVFTLRRKLNEKFPGGTGAQAKRLRQEGHVVQAGKGKAARMPPARVLVLLVGFIFLMAIDGLNSYISLMLGRPLLYQPHNLLRLMTGTLHGLALSIIVFPIFNFTLWKEPNTKPALAGLRDLGLIIFLLAR